MFLQQRKAIAIKLETTAGTAITPLTADLFYLIDPIVQPEFPMTERDALGSIGTLASVPGLYSGKASFKFDVIGGSSGSPPAWANVILPSCGFVASSGAFKPTSNPALQKTVTIVEYLQGPTGQWLTKTLYGAMGNVKFDFEDGKPIQGSVDYKGIWSTVTDSAGIGIAAFGAAPPRFAGTTFTTGSYTPQIGKFSLDMGNTVAYQENINNVSGLQQAVVTARKPKGKIDPMMTNVATWDVWSEFLSGAQQAMSLAIPTPSGGSITIAAPALQFAGPQEAQKDKFVTTELECMFHESAGDDCVSITFA